MNPQKTIRIVFFSDTHLGFDYPIRPKVKRRRRGQDFFDNYHRVLEFTSDSKADLLIHGGDLFFRSRVPQKIIDLAYEPLIEFMGNGIPVFLIPGNHEHSNLPPSLFLNHQDIHVFERAMTVTVERNGARISVSGFPFHRENIRDRFHTILDATEWNRNSADIRLLCFHQAIEGAQVGPRNFTFRRGMDVIQKIQLPTDIHAILVGHIHRQQILWMNDGHKKNKIPIIHSGSTERTSFAEKGEHKGFFDIQFGRLSDNRWRIEGLRFIELPARPMVDLHLPKTLKTSEVTSFLQNHISRFQQNAIVRLTGDRDLEKDIRNMMTGKFLRDIVPETMNIQFGSGFNARKKETQSREKG